MAHFQIAPVAASPAVAHQCPWHHSRLMPDTLRIDHEYSKEFVDDFGHLLLSTLRQPLAWMFRGCPSRLECASSPAIGVWRCALMVACAVPAAFQPRDTGHGITLPDCVGSLGLRILFAQSGNVGRNQGKSGVLSFCVVDPGAMQGQIGTQVKVNPTSRP